MSRTLLLFVVAVALLCLVVPANAWDYTSRVSIASDGSQGNQGLGGTGYDIPISVSSDGRFIAFESESTNLVPWDRNSRRDIFVHDRATGQTTRVSVASGGFEANDNSSYPSISANGQYVAFESAATNMVSGDSNNYNDIFVHDRISGLTTRVSVATGGVQADQASYTPSISGDGRYVTFSSYAANLVPGDSNYGSDIFVHDRTSGQTTRVSVATGGVQANGHSDYPSISADGRYIAFDSAATNLVSGDWNSAYDIFVHDRITSVTSRVSVATGGAEGDSHSSHASISANGSCVAFSSDASNLVSDDGNSREDVFIHDRTAGTTGRVSVATGGTGGNDDSSFPSLSSDGRFVAFESQASNLVTGDGNHCSDVFVHDRNSGTTKRISVASGGGEGNLNSNYAFISSNGQYVAFISKAANLVPGDTNTFDDVFVHTDAIRENAVFRPSASKNWIFTKDLSTVKYRDHYGIATDKPLVGDFNNDGAIDRAVFRNGNWIVDWNMDGSVNSNTHFGVQGDIPVVAYFNNDRITDRAVFRNGQWIVDYSMDGSVDSRTCYGVAGDIPFAGDINLDGTTDRAVFRNGQWIIDLGMDGIVDSRGSWGLSSDIPLMGWIDGNIIMDRAVFRNGEWVMDYNMDGSVDWRPRFGTAGDRPLSWVEI